MHQTKARTRRAAHARNSIVSVQVKTTMTPAQAAWVDRINRFFADPAKVRDWMDCGSGLADQCADD